MMKQKTRKTGRDRSDWAVLNVRRLAGDIERIERFFAERPELKRGDFYRRAILRELDRVEAQERQRAAIDAGTTQIDPSLLRPVATTGAEAPRE